VERASDPLRAAPAPVPDELFARIAVQKGLATLGSLRECLDILRRSTRSRRPEQTVEGRGKPAAERRPLSSVMLRQGVLSRQEVELLERGVRAGSVESRSIGRYELLADIGEGGMGTVHAAMDSSTLRFCALKILPKELAEAEDIVKRFLQEAETACTLRHQNIVGGLEVGEDNGVHFFSMEFVDGETVYDRLEQEAVLPEGECLRIAKGIALGLQYACEHGLVHRDMKPENIMIDRDGTPKLLDMGLVKRTDTARVTRLTQSGMAIGTPHYISPEQARGEDKVDTRSDIYALGATLYHMVTGQVPFEGNTAAVIMTKHLTEELDWPSDVNPDVSEHTSRLISRMMAKERQDRYTRPKDVVADIDLILTGRAPSGDMLPPGVSSIRGAVSIARARDKAAAKARTTSVYERIKKRSREGWLLIVKDRVKAYLKKHLQGRARYRARLRPAAKSPGRAKALFWAAGVLVALNLVVLVMYLAADPGPDPDKDGELPPPGATAAHDDPASPGPVDASSDRARLDAEAEKQLREILDRVRADPRLRDRALEELRDLRRKYAASSVAPRIDEAIAWVSALPPPGPSRPAPPPIEPVHLVKDNSLQGWRPYGDWKAEGTALVFRYDTSRKYSRAIQSSFGFGELTLTAEIRTRGGTRAEIAVWDQATEDRRKGAQASCATVVLRGEGLEPARERWARLRVMAGPRRVRMLLGDRELKVRREGTLRNGRVRFSLAGGVWRIRGLEVTPALGDGAVAYEAGFGGGESHGWEGKASEEGLRATGRRDGTGSVWAALAGKRNGSAQTLFIVTGGMRVALAFRVNRVFDLKMRLESSAGESYAFRLSGRAPERRWTALTVPLADFRNNGDKPPPAGTVVTGLAVGAEGERPELTLSLERVLE